MFRESKSFFAEKKTSFGCFHQSAIKYGHDAATILHSKQLKGQELRTYKIHFIDATWTNFYSSSEISGDHFVYPILRGAAALDEESQPGEGLPETGRN